MRKVLLFFIFIFIGFTQGYGQEGKKMTLKECVDIALEKNLRIKRSIYNVETFRANMLQAKGAFLPSLNASGSYTNNYGRALNPTTNLFVDKNSTTITPSLNSTLPLFNGLRINVTSGNSAAAISALPSVEALSTTHVSNVSPVCARSEVRQPRSSSRVL